MVVVEADGGGAVCKEGFCSEVENSISKEVQRNILIDSFDISSKFKQKENAFKKQKQNVL